MSQNCGSCVAQLDPLLGASPASVKLSSELGFFLEGGSEEESPSKYFEVVGKILFPEIIGLEIPLPWWLLAMDSSASGCPHSLASGSLSASSEAAMAGHIPLRP